MLGSGLGCSGNDALPERTPRRAAPSIAASSSGARLRMSAAAAAAAAAALAAAGGVAYGPSARPCFHAPLLLA
eukprot:354414-Chlamydomonas_euryale.AAC.1